MFIVFFFFLQKFIIVFHQHFENKVNFSVLKFIPNTYVKEFLQKNIFRFWAIYSHYYWHVEIFKSLKEIIFLY